MRCSVTTLKEIKTLVTLGAVFVVFLFLGLPAFRMSKYLGLSIFGFSFVYGLFWSFIFLFLTRLFLPKSSVSIQVLSFLLYYSAAFNFSIFVPVFLDRSITYHFLIKLVQEHSHKMELKQSISEITKNEAAEYRINLLKQSGHIKVMSDGSMGLTLAGEQFATILLELQKYSHIYPNKGQANDK